MPDIARQVNSSPRIVLTTLLILSLAGGVVVFEATQNGPGGFSDSVEYIVTARNFLNGSGLGLFMPSGRFVLTYLHPPLYSLLLSGIGVWGIDLLGAARWSNIILFAVTIFINGLIFLRFSRIPSLAVLAGLLTLSFPVVLEVFTQAISEPLFLFLFSFSSFLLLHYLQRHSERSLFAAAVVGGLMPVTRYVGVAFLLSAGLCVLWFTPGSWKKRIGRTFLFGLFAVLPLAIWFAALSFGSGGGLGGRSFQPDWEQISTGFYHYRDRVTEILWDWIPFSRRQPFAFFYENRYLFIVVSIPAVAVLTWLAGARQAGRERDWKEFPDVQIATLFGLGVLSYVVVYMTTWLFTIPQPDLIARLLMPIYYGAVLGLLGCWGTWRGAWFATGRAVMRAVPWLVALVVGYWFFPQWVDVATQSRKNDTLLAYRWRDSELIRAVRELPEGTPVISNRSAAVLMWADRPAFEMMDGLRSDFIGQTTPYGADDADAVQRVFREGAVLVVFDSFPSQLETKYGDRGTMRLETIFDGLIVLSGYPEGGMYVFPGNYSD